MSSGPSIGLGPNVLVVEDERDIRDLILLHLAREGFRCRTAATGTEALQAARSALPDLVVLDLMLPELGGLEVCRRLRSDPASAALPIIMLTAKADEVDRVVGLEMGADDYIVKPFSPKELVARVRAVLRRSRRAEAPRALKAGGLSLDPGRHEVTLDGASVALTPKEFELLQALMEAGGRVLSREHLLDRVWGYARADEIESRTVDVHVRRLRAKLGAEGRRIVTVKTVGYRFEAAAIDGDPGQGR
jgi:phosphate regulon transcriptional regulator PhoB